MYENQYLSTVLPPRALYFCVRLYSANHQGLPIVLLVLAPQGFVLLRTSVRCASQRPLCGARPNGLCAVRAYKGFIQCAPGLVLLSHLCTVRAPRALRGASLQRLCASVYRTSAKSFARCEPTNILCLCVLYEPHELFSVRAYKDFIQCAPGLVLLVLYEPHELCAVRAYKGFIQCALYEPHELCAVRTYKGFIQCAGVRPPSFGPSAYVPVRSYEQMSSCTRTCTYALVRMYCTSSHVICGSVRKPICLYVAERSIHVELVRLRVFCEHPQSRTI